MKGKQPKVVGTIAAVLCIVLVLTGAWLQRYLIFDIARTVRYDPPDAVEQIANDLSLSDETRRTFYAYYPSLEGKDTFKQHCAVTEKTNVLGCYVSLQGIYLYDVTDPRLDGVVEVTAAHEILHAAYERLSRSEKTRINTLLREVYESLNDNRLKETIRSYEESGADILNELHSIIATEIQDIPTELEKYYSQYFIDRSSIVGLFTNYQSEFISRREKVNAADQRLEELWLSYENLNQRVSSEAIVLQQEYASLIALRDSGNIRDYNDGVEAYNELVRTYNSDVTEVQRMIDEYNALVVERNAIAIEEYELSQAIDSRPTPIKTQ